MPVGRGAVDLLVALGLGLEVVRLEAVRSGLGGRLRASAAAAGEREQREQEREQPSDGTSLTPLGYNRRVVAFLAAALLALAPQPLAGKTVAIDPGHNGRNWAHTTEINRLVDAGTLRKACDTTGAETAGGYTEAAYNLDVALRLARILRAAGARVVLTRATNDGWGPCITTRAAIGNRAHADAAISIHADGGPASGRGFHVIYAPRDRRAHRRHRRAVAAARACDPLGVPRRHRRARLDVRRPRRARRSLRPRRAQPLRRAEGADRDREHAQRDRRGADRVGRVPAARGAGARARARALPRLSPSFPASRIGARADDAHGGRRRLAGMFAVNKGRLVAGSCSWS